MIKNIILVLISFLSLTLSGQKFEGLAPTPPMGWNSWNWFGCDVSEKLIKEIAEAIVQSGMQEAGYQYIVVDDCWQISRDSAGNILADPQRFPSGIKSLVDYVHSRRLKFGIYSCAGRKTCQKRPGSRGYEFQDARQYAAWGVDYLKFDWCNTTGQNAEESYRTMSDAIYAAGRPMLFSICDWGYSKPWTWAAKVGHLWRTTDDILDCWDCGDTRQNIGFVKILDKQAGLEKFAGPDHWNDPDMLQVGNSGLTISEGRAHFALWCLLAAPLMAGNDVRNMKKETKEILTNKELIDINQDKLGIQGYKVRDDEDLEVWMKPLSDGSKAVVMFNRGEIAKEIICYWPEIDLYSNIKARVRDLYLHSDLGVFDVKYKALIPAHDVAALRIYPVK
ncbi:MAG: glycoside hydrolase family 27 protein [Saprospiraceae bacterium]|nr:glycoside hydrolase family 27 protein [Saprospiraceae bacterium]